MVERESEYRFCSRYGLHWQDKKTISDISSLYGEHECIKAGRCKYTTQGLFWPMQPFTRIKWVEIRMYTRTTWAGKYKSLPEGQFFYKKNISRKLQIYRTQGKHEWGSTQKRQKKFTRTPIMTTVCIVFFIYIKNLWCTVLAHSHQCWWPKVWFILL